MADQTPPIAASPRGLRIRFSLRTLLLLMTALCLACGYQTSRRQRAEQIRARHFSFVQIINSNSSTPPMATQTARERSSRWRGFTNVRGAGMYCTSTRRIGLNVDPPLADDLDSTIASQIADHYGRGLEEMGLTPESTESGELTKIAVWRSPRYGMSVTVEVRVASAAGAKTADVEINLAHNERVDFW